MKNSVWKIMEWRTPPGAAKHGMRWDINFNRKISQRRNETKCNNGRDFGWEFIYRKDMVKADCRGCEGCSACAWNMGNSLQLDPYDIWQLSTGLGKNFEEMLQSGWIELGVTDGMILPYLKTNQDAGAGDADVDAEPKGACPFLNQEGRCKVHGVPTGNLSIIPVGTVL